MTLGGGTMIGAGIFILPGIAAEGAGPASSISFAIAGFVALLAALSLAELATGMPIAGGSYHYVNRGLGSLFGSVVGWGMWTGLMFASAFYMIGFGQYIVEPIPGLNGRTLIVAFGLLGLMLITGVNYYGTEESSGAQNVMIGTELAIVLVYTGLGLFFIDTANLADFAPTGAGGVLATTGTVFVTFLGFEIIATVAGEVKKPGKLIPLTMVLSVVSVTLLYVVVMLVSTGVIPYQQLGGSLVPVSEVAVVYMGSAGVVAIVFAAVIAAISSSNSSILAASRVIFAMGRDGLMSDWLNVTHDRFDTPHRAILATGGVTGLLVALGLEVEAIVALLAEVASFSFLVSYALVHVSLVVFRRADPPEYDPDFAVPGPLYPAVPILGVVMTGVVIWQMDRVVQLVGIGVVALGVVWYAAYARGDAMESGFLDEALNRGPSSAYTVVVPVSNPDTQRGLIRLAAASARENADDDAVPTLVATNVLRVAGDPDRQNVAAARLDHQRELLAATEEIATEMDVRLETRAVVAPDVGDAILDAVRDADADHAVLGWKGSFTGGPFGFGSNVDPVLAAAPCDVTLAGLGASPSGGTVALVGDGPNAPVAARRAVEFASADGGRPTLLNVRPAADDADADPVERGEAAIAAVGERAGLDPDEYDARVVVDGDVETALLDATVGRGLVCLGLSDRDEVDSGARRALAERAAERTDGDVAVASAGDDGGPETDA
ncbi:amino acid permease [Halorubrum sp. BOL3-1]|uniref:amino acid permease n=1 Tax=Halorubrum sp. BOL3-1 TaxID=2497325 RepID=UPI0019D59DC3